MFWGIGSLLCHTFIKAPYSGPRLVCEVAYAEWTQDEQLRQTTVLGWRDDKSAKDVVL
jgi:ATP-dependent DNA ligase